MLGDEMSGGQGVGAVAQVAMIEVGEGGSGIIGDADAVAVSRARTGGQREEMELPAGDGGGQGDAFEGLGGRQADLGVKEIDVEAGSAAVLIA